MVVVFGLAWAPGPLLWLAGVIAPARVPTAARRALDGLRGSVRAGVLPALVEGHLHATALGHLVLAEADDWREAVHHPSRLVALTDATPTRPVDVEACLAKVRAHGWAGQTGQLHEGVGCLAVPVRGATGLLVAAVAVSSARGVVPTEYLDAARACAATLAPLLD